MLLKVIFVFLHLLSLLSLSFVELPSEFLNKSLLLDIIECNSLVLLFDLVEVRDRLFQLFGLLICKFIPLH